MINLTATDQSLEVVLGGAITTNQLDINAAGSDLLSSDQSVSAVLSAHTVTNNTTPVSVIAAPASGHTRVVKEVSVYNKDTVAADVTIQVNVGGTRFIVEKATLAAGSTLLYQG